MVVEGNLCDFSFLFLAGVGNEGDGKERRMEILGQRVTISSGTVGLLTPKDLDVMLALFHIYGAKRIRGTTFLTTLYEVVNVLYGRAREGGGLFDVVKSSLRRLQANEIFIEGFLDVPPRGENSELPPLRRPLKIRRLVGIQADAEFHRIVFPEEIVRNLHNGYRLELSPQELREILGMRSGYAKTLALFLKKMMGGKDCFRIRLDKLIRFMGLSQYEGMSPALRRNRVERFLFPPLERACRFLNAVCFLCDDVLTISRRSGEVANPGEGGDERWSSSSTA
ncbi:MAG: hypothetical protein QXO86_05825 [Nitrososphaerota archaeon]